MWLLMIFWKTFRGMWRLVIGLIIGVVLYVITFTDPNLVWIFNGVYVFSNSIIDWMSAQSWFEQYEKWNNLVKPGDRLPLILYVLVGRFIWLLLEAVFLTFPYWLIFGRGNEKSAARSPQTASIAQQAAYIAPESIASAKPVMPSLASAPNAGAAMAKNAVPVVAAAGSSVAVGAQDLTENAENLERSIDEALDRIKNVGKSGTNS